MANRLSEKQKKIIIDSFKNGRTIKALSKEFKFTASTIVRNLKKNLGEEIYKDLVNKQKESIENTTLTEDEKNYDGGLILEKANNNYEANRTFDTNKKLTQSSSPSEFVEISPLIFEIENTPRKELSSVPIEQIELPKMVYMIVDKNIELKIKLLKDYPVWEFLPEEDLKRKTIEIFFDLKIAKRLCSKEQKVIKVPNPDVFKIVSSILISRGISRIVSPEKLIAL